MKKLYFLVLLSLFMIGMLQGQPWSYNYGTGAGTHSSGASTTFLPTPSTGTAYVRVGTGSGSINLENPGLSALGSDTELRIVAPTTASATKFSLYDYTPGKTFFTKFDVLLGNSSGGNTATSGTIVFLQGDGSTYADGTTISGTQVFTGLQWVFGGSGAVTTTYRSGSAWASLGSTPFTQGNVYTVEIYGNNTTSSTTYSRSGSDYTIASNKLDIWINGSIIGDDLAKAQLANDANIDSFMFYGVSSIGNVANCFLDNFTYSNILPAPSGLTPPTLTADATNNSVDNNIDITFTDNATWRAAVTGVKIGGTALTLTTDYVISAGNLQLKPSGLNALLTASGTKNVTVEATGYTTASVSQVINPGTPTTNSTATINLDLLINTSRTVTCTAKDQYNNLVTGYVFRYDATVTNTNATTNESYTINGNATTISAADVTITATNTSGVATFGITIPAIVDGGDGLSVQVQLNDGSTNIGSAFSYTKALTAPVISSPTATSITGSSAILGGNITSDGESPITERGTVWSTSSPVTIDDNKLAEGGTTAGVFTHTRSSLPPESTIYYCAYATNAIGTTLSVESNFITKKAEPTSHVTSFVAGTTTVSTIPLTWADAAKVTPDGYLIKGSDTGFSSISTPVDGTDEINSTLVRNITQGTQSFTFTGLNSTSTYYFKIYPYTNSGIAIDYKTDGIVPQVSAITQTASVLAPGDIAIIAFQTDTDQFAFITFVDILSGTEIKFTDNGWNDAGLLISTEGTITWTAPSTKSTIAGSIVTVTTGSPWTSDIGTVAYISAPAFSTSGDQLLAYQGLATSPTILYAISTTPWVTSGAISSNTTYLPSGLVDGTTALAFATEVDDQYYNVTTITGTPATILVSIGDPANWTRDNAQLALPLWNVETLPVELSSFTASISAQNFVNLMWTTQSETGVSGFYIYRGTIEDASQAELISPMILATNTSVTHTYLFTDNQLYNDGVYYYWLQNVDFDGTNSFHGPVVVNYSTETGGPGTPVIPEVTELKGIFPNPFNPTAQISYSLKDAASVSIKVYNSRGQIVRSFDNAPGTVGNHRIVWDGRDFRGSSCSTGVYFVRMFAGKEVFTQKAVLVK